MSIIRIQSKPGAIAVVRMCDIKAMVLKSTGGEVLLLNQRDGVPVEPEEAERVADAWEAWSDVST